jgi:chromosome segregation ATPase
MVAAAVLLAASAAIVLLAGNGNQQRESSATHASELKDLKQQVKRLRGEVADSRAALAEAAEQLATLPEREKDLRRTIEDEYEKLLANRRKRWEQQQLKPALAKLGELKDKLDVREARLDMLRAQLTKAGTDPNRVAELKKQLGEAGDELTATRLAMGRQQEKIDALEKSAKQRRGKLASLEADLAKLQRQSRQWKSFRRQRERTWQRMASVYVRRLAGVRQGAEAVVAAAQRADLGERLAGAQRSTDLKDDRRRLLATLEVVAVRLELLDASDTGRVSELLAAVRKQRLLERIDDALVDEALSRRLAMLLTEAKLLLLELTDAA